MLSHSIASGCVQPHGLQPTRLLCPWDFPGKNTGEGCYVLLQGIFLTQGPNSCLLHLLYWQVDSLPLHHLGSPDLTAYYKRTSWPSHVSTGLFFVLTQLSMFPAVVESGFGIFGSRKVLLESASKEHLSETGMLVVLSKAEWACQEFCRHRCLFWLIDMPSG